MKTFIKNYMKAVGVVCACMAAFPACTDMMETDSTTVGFEEDNRLDSPNDSLYSVLGILSQVQRLGDRYVLLGELRGDLMEATADANVDIQEISNFSVSSGNEYASFMIITMSLIIVIMPLRRWTRILCFTKIRL